MLDGTTGDQNGSGQLTINESMVFVSTGNDSTVATSLVANIAMPSSDTKTSLLEVDGTGPLNIQGNLDIGNNSSAWPTMSSGI
nr:hypothetical protein [Marinicella sp. W31]MDC2879246.1 hypothetical protein [Marinicella sp. W31]